MSAVSRVSRNLLEGTLQTKNFFMVHGCTILNEKMFYMFRCSKYYIFLPCYSAVPCYFKKLNSLILIEIYKHF